MGSVLIKYIGERAKPELSRENRAQFQADAEVPEQSAPGLYQVRRRSLRRAIVNNENNFIVMSNVRRNQLYVRAVEEGQNIYTLVPDNNQPRDGVIKINENRELTFSDDPGDEDEGVKFETSPCERGDCLILTLIDSEVQGRLYVRPDDNVLVVDGEEYTGFQIR